MGTLKLGTNNISTSGAGCLRKLTRQWTVVGQGFLLVPVLVIASYPN